MKLMTSSFGFGHSTFFGHSDFDIRHSDWLNPIFLAVNPRHCCTESVTTGKILSISLDAFRSSIKNTFDPTTSVKLLSHC